MSISRAKGLNYIPQSHKRSWCDKADS